jgi:hypothetical protein
LSLVVLTHVAPQAVWPIGHTTEGRHAPIMHAWPIGHAAPQAPQFALSDWVSTHAPPQLVCPAGHIGPLSDTLASTGGIATSDGGMSASAGGMSASAGGIVTSTGGIVTSAGGIVTSAGGMTTSRPGVVSGRLASGRLASVGAAASIPASSGCAGCEHAATAAAVQSSHERRLNPIREVLQWASEARRGDARSATDE